MDNTSNSYNLDFWLKYAKNVNIVVKFGKVDHRKFDHIIIGSNEFKEVGAYTFNMESETDKNVIREIVNNGSIVLAIDDVYMAGIKQERFTLPKNISYEKAIALSKALIIAYIRGWNYCPRSL